MRLFLTPKISNSLKKLSLEKYASKKTDEEIQILKDVFRTPLPLGLNEPQKEKYFKLIRQILIAYASLNKSVGYVQGMNIIASAILFNICPDYDHLDNYSEDAFKLFVNLIDGYEIGKHYENKMIKIIKLFKELEIKIEKENPKVYQHIMKTDVILKE